MSTVPPSSTHRVTVSSAGRRFVTFDRRGRKPCCPVVSSDNWDKWDSSFSFEDHLKNFSNDRCEAGGSELPWVCCVGAFCDWVYYCAAPIFRDLGSLK